MKRLATRLAQRVRRLPRVLLVGLVGVFGLVFVTGSVFMYRAYDYIQHDNEFCNQCHLMSEPFTAFSESAHRGLGCKACHRPNIWQRSWMGMVAIVENPEEIGPHAPVPNEICGECHVNGDPEKWQQIASSVGHRVHLESADPSLEGLRCVTCHASSIHEFATADRTCGRAECHALQSEIQLGSMSNLTIHCASCHDFNRPVVATVAGDSLTAALGPTGNDCLACHQMRERVRDFPADEPHGGKCGTCHNPHAQTQTADAVRSCASGGCHERVDTVSAFHVGLAAGTLERCTTCHRAHSWKVMGTDCIACHSPESLDQPRRRIAPAPRHQASGMSLGGFELIALPWKLVIAALQQEQDTIMQRPRAERLDQPFSHRPHRSVTCTTCHTAEDGHGLLKVRTVTDCQGCHHSNQNASRCTNCHTTRELAGRAPRTLRVLLTVWKAPREKTLGFEHRVHEKTACLTCHETGPKYEATKSCASCHEDHHAVERNCITCHNSAIEGQPHDRRVHLTCAGSGCHTDPITPRLPNARSVCLSCHQDQVQHEPGGDCATCHLIPRRKVSVAGRKP